MADREERKEQAAKHTALMKGAFASDTQETIEAATIYEEGEARGMDLPDAPFEATETLVTTSFLPEALYRFGKGACVVVDPASFTRPGGAYLDGASGPEQILCADSNLFEVLCGIKRDFHDKNRDYRRGQLFTDRAAFLPGVAFSRGGEVRKAGVIVIAEPLRARALENHRSEAECDRELERRIATLLNIAAANGAETLLVNAFACGRMGYPAQQVVDVFKAWLDGHPGALERVVFAVPRAHLDAFDAAFGKPKEEAPVVAASDEDATDDEDWRNVELPEGVTLR